MEAAAPVLVNEYYFSVKLLVGIYLYDNAVPCFGHRRFYCCCGGLFGFEQWERKAAVLTGEYRGK